jgi:hypothetical protein
MKLIRNKKAIAYSCKCASYGVWLSSRKYVLELNFHGYPLILWASTKKPLFRNIVLLSAIVRIILFPVVIVLSFLILFVLLEQKFDLSYSLRNSPRFTYDKILNYTCFVLVILGMIFVFQNIF